LIKSNQAYNSASHAYDIDVSGFDFTAHKAIALKGSTRWFIPAFDLELISYIHKTFGKGKSIAVGVTDVVTWAKDTEIALVETAFTETVDVYVFD